MIRPAKQSDMAALGRVYAETWKEAYRGLLPDFFLDILTPETCTPKPDHIAPDRRLVADEGDVIGTVTFSGGEIQSLYVLPEYWSKGVGSALFREAVKVLKNRGFNTVTLWVQQGNDRARNFFEQMGMAPAGQTRDSEICGTYLTEIQYKLQ